jgi:CRISPR/Cas system CSM-associated protein Csm3 (group 7 of RAMP superfamily)
MKAACKLDRPLVEHEKCEYFEDCLYTRLFGEEFGKASKVFFRYAYPLHLKCGGVYQIAPRTLYECRNPQCQKTYDRMIPPEQCEACQKAVRAYLGYQCDRCGDLERYPISMSRVTLTALDREKRSAALILGSEEAMGTLHTLELIDRGSRFSLDMLVHRDSREDVNALRAALERGVPDEGVGGGKSRGLGKIEVQDAVVEEVTIESVERRAETINPKRFSLRLLSPMLLAGEALEPEKLLEGARRAYAWVFHEGKPTLPDVTSIGHRIVSDWCSGWSLKKGVRRPLEPSLAAGSVFQFQCDSDDRKLALALAALEWYPLGAYKPHGYGQVRVEGPR